MNKLYLIGNSHIDPVWLWRWQEGFAEILATFRSALDRMEEFDYMIYTSACAAYYQWVETIDPEMFSQIQQRVREGRWNIVGGWLIQPDCNIPSGESFARQGLISQRYFKEKFGITAKTAYNVDSFGHNASMPQIFKKSGMDNYIFMRPGPHENATLDDIFIWESPDGSKVKTYRIPVRYCITEDFMEIFDEIKEMSDKSGRNMMAFYGVGNHGGGPTIKLMDAMKDYPALKDAKYSNAENFFEETSFENAITVKNELQHHAIGCYSACSYVKKANRKCENNLITAEKMCIMANKLCGMPYPAEELKNAWKNVLFNQFHDILAGCAIKEAYTDASYSYGETMSVTEKAINRAATAIAKKIDTLCGKQLPSYKKINTVQWRVWETDSLGTPVVVFNPHCHEVSTIIELTSSTIKVTDEYGDEIANQKVRASHSNGNDCFYSAFKVNLPPYGYRVYRIFPGRENTLCDTSLKISTHTLENNKLYVEFDKTSGEIKQIYNKQTNEYIINSLCKTILVDESDCDTWAHDKDRLGDETDVFSDAEFEITETGPVRATLRITNRCSNTIIRRDYTLADDCDTLTVKTFVDFREKHKALKLAFPLAGEHITAAIPYGTIQRSCNTGEEPCQEFVSCKNLGIANDSLYGYDTENGYIRMTALRGAIYADHFGNRAGATNYMEQGENEFTYAIFPYTDKADASRRASQLNVAPIVYIDSFHSGTLGQQMSCISSDCTDAVVTAIKQSEDNDGTIIRICEMNGKNTNANIKLFDTDINQKIAHNEIKTLKIQGLNTIEVNLTEY